MAAAAAYGGFGGGGGRIFTAGGDRRVAVDGELAGQAPAAPTQLSALDGLVAEELVNRDIDNSLAIEEALNGEIAPAVATAGVPVDHVEACLAGRKDAFEILGLDINVAPAYTKRDIEKARDSVIAAYPGDTEGMQKLASEAYGTLTGYDYSRPLFTVGGPAPAVDAKWAQEEYKKALARSDAADAGGGVDAMQPHDERNAWKSFAKMISVIEQLPAHIRKECKSDLKPIQIMIAGDESSGKSSLAQRIVGRELFAIKESICTKVPTKLMFKRSRHQHGLLVRLRNTATGAVQKLNASTMPVMHDPRFYYEVNKTVERFVDGHWNDDSGFAQEDCTLEILFFAPDVPELELYDLPGMRSGDSNFAKQTRKWAVDLLSEPTAIAVTVWHSGLQSMASPQLFGICSQVKRKDPNFNNRHVAVMSAADVAAVRSDADVHAKKEQRKMISRLEGTPQDVTECKAFLQTWIPVVNHIEGSKDVRVQPALALQHEDDQLKLCQLPAVADPAKKYGLRALHHQINEVVDNQLRTTWKTKCIQGLKRYSRNLETFSLEQIGAVLSPADVNAVIISRAVDAIHSGSHSSASRCIASIARHHSRNVRGAFAACNVDWEAVQPASGSAAGMLSTMSFGAPALPAAQAGGGLFGSAGAMPAPARASATSLDPKQCRVLRQKLGSHIDNGKVKVIFGHVADEVTANVFGKAPEVNRLKYGVQTEPLQDPEHMWRFMDERRRFRDAMFKKLTDNHTAEFTALLSTVMCPLVEAVGSFTNHLENVLFDVLSEVAGTEAGVKAWYPLHGNVESELAKDARARIEKVRGDIQRAVDEIEARLPAPAGGEPVLAGGGAAAAGGGGGAIARPDAHYCPIMKEVMVDPVIAADGHSYERGNIAQWIARGNRTSPKTGAALSHVHLMPNHTLKQGIQEPHWPSDEIEARLPAAAYGGFGGGGGRNFTAGGDRRVTVDGELAGQAPAAPTALDSLVIEEVLNRDIDNAAPTFPRN